MTFITYARSNGHMLLTVQDSEWYKGDHRAFVKETKKDVKTAYDLLRQIVIKHYGKDIILSSSEGKDISQMIIKKPVSHHKIMSGICEICHDLTLEKGFSTGATLDMRLDS